MKIEIADLTPDGRREAAQVLADALIDDPAFVAIGPDRPARRRRLVRRHLHIVVGEALKRGGPNWCARSDGEIVGVALTVDGERFPLRGSTVREAPPFLLAGPGPALRAARTDAVIHRIHPREPHRYLWYLGTRPDRQRRGAGRALVQRVIEEAQGCGLPVFLDTTKAENVGYYRSLGFRETGEEPLPRGARLWPMRRDLP